MGWLREGWPGTGDREDDDDNDINDGQGPCTRSILTLTRGRERVTPQMGTGSFWRLGTCPNARRAEFGDQRERSGGTPQMLAWLCLQAPQAVRRKGFVC